MNDGIPSNLCSLQYILVEQAARLVATAGIGALMAKTDLKSAYRHIPVHPADQHLLGIQWNDVTYIDRALPFGLCSAPKLFTAIADGMAWALRCEGIHNCIHYLDDFLLWGPPGSQQCSLALERTIEVCARLGLPTAPNKTVEPTTCLTFLGIEIDSISQELRLPPDKLSRLRAMLSRWLKKRNASKHELDVLLGHLNHAAATVRQGRLFTFNLKAMAKRLRRRSHRARLNLDCRADLIWWEVFVQDWNGVGLFPSLPQGHTIISDALGSWGCGAYCQETSQWLQLHWPQSWASINIAVKELLPILLCAAIWGPQWHGSTVLFYCDNEAVVSCLSSLSAREPYMCPHVFLPSLLVSHICVIFSAACSFLKPGSDSSIELATLPGN